VKYHSVSVLVPFYVSHTINAGYVLTVRRKKERKERRKVAIWEVEEGLLFGL